MNGVLLKSWQAWRKANRMKKATLEPTITSLSDQGESDLPVGLAQPARRALLSAGIFRLEQLTTFSEAEVKQLHGIGPKALDQLRHALEMQGLRFAIEK